MKTMTKEKAIEVLKNLGISVLLWRTSSLTTDKYQTLICEYGTVFAIAVYDRKTDNVVERFNVPK